MRVFGAMVVCLGLALNASAEVFVNVYRCDGTTPLSLKDPNTPNVFSDIMVGTHLVFVVSSDAPVPVHESWWGALVTTWEDWDRGQLAGRDCDPDHPSGNCKGSCLESAGRAASAAFRADDHVGRIGYDLFAGSLASAGDWFILDYWAETVGSCDVRLFEYAVINDETPVEIIAEALTFTHVPSRDLNSDHVVNFRDFASLVSHWRQTAGPDPASPALPDLDGNGLIGPSDIAQFCDFWLERTDCSEAAAEP